MLMKAGKSNPRTYQLAGGTRVYNTTQPNVANVVWTLTGAASGNGRVVGRVQNDGYDSGDAISFIAGTDFTTPNTGWGTLYVRLTATSGTPDSSTHAVDGTTWHTLTEGAVNISWTETHGGPVTESCTVLVEIATDSGGTNIVASGSYTSSVLAEP